MDPSSEARPETAPTGAPFVHPETGEVLVAAADFRRALSEVEERLSPLWRLRSELQEAFADRYETDLPARLKRTAKQEVVARCPSCRRVVSEEDAIDVAIVERLRQAPRLAIR